MTGYPKNKATILMIVTIIVITFAYIWPLEDALSAESAKQIPSNRPQKPNRLIHETSPYLQQHATNPIDWYPWSNAAFDKATKEDKPIFLSIGYSTCHWCHVMEHESFSDKEVAELLNQYFVSIKVDREERPDIDQVYMAVTQTITGRGGWPMTIIMTPDKKPFFAGTYFPKTTRWERPGLMELLPKVVDAWKNDREKVLSSAEQITQHVIGLNKRLPGTDIDQKTLEKSQAFLAEMYDPQHGGFGTSPKFPSPHQLIFLLRRYHHTQNQKALEMVEKTLINMRLGGIYDHVGYGFHRYSTDAKWLVPHFEKMLYDQALLTMAYIEAYQAIGRTFYSQVVREIIAYVLRDMTSAEGGFFSAEDADSEGVEGKFYLWTTSEIRKIFDPANAELFEQVYNMKKEGNFHSEEAGQVKGSNILHLSKQLPEIAGALGITTDQLSKQLKSSREKIFCVREDRVHPFKDDKILTDWNGLMIAALAKAGNVLGENLYTAAAEKSAGFVLQKLRDDNGRLLKRYRQGKAGLSAHLNDYAFMVWGLLELYEATYKTKYLKEALALNHQMLNHFWDEQNGGFFLTADDSEKLLVRSKEIYDGAIPSGNSVAAMNLLRLGHMTGTSDFLSKSNQIIKAFSVSVKQYPAAHCQLMVALEFALNPNYEVVIVGKPQGKGTRAMLSALRDSFIPEKVVLFKPADQNTNAEIVRLAPFTKSMVATDGYATAYVCQRFMCKLPTTDIDQMLENLIEN